MENRISYFNLIIILGLMLSSSNVLSQDQSNTQKSPLPKEEIKSSTQKKTKEKIISPEYINLKEGKSNNSNPQSQHYIELFTKSIPLLQTIFWVGLIAFVFFKIKDELGNLLNAFTDRIKKGSSLEIASIKLGSEREFVKNTDELKEEYEDKGVVVVGNPDNLVLLFSAKTELFHKSTKAISVEGGCIVQVTSSNLQKDGSWRTAEALTFVPKVKIVEDENGGHKLI